MKQIILASGSPRRKQLLEKIGFTFDIHPSTVDETYDPQWSPQKIVDKLAAKKAADVAPNHKNAFVIAADTIVVYKDEILEKPESHAEAKAMLTKLSDATHRVISGVALLMTDESKNILKQTSFTESTEVHFGPIHPALIDSYTATDKPMDKAGAYGIQDPHGALFVKAIKGDYYNVVGFPLHSFYNTVSAFAPDVLALQEHGDFSNEL